MSLILKHTAQHAVGNGEALDGPPTLKHGKFDLAMLFLLLGGWMSNDQEVCQRCDDKGEDRRTLWMACFYAMNELGLPFEQCAIDGLYLKSIGEEKTAFGTIPVYPKDAGGEKRQYNFFTLRVCKDCRADWMNAIRTWFDNKPVRESCGSGIFVRRNGATVEISREEWDEENPGREPVVFKE